MDEMDVIRLYRLGASRRDIAKSLKISDNKVRKILITAGAPPVSRTGDRVSKLFEKGFSQEEICEILGLSKSAVNSHIPYTKSIYNSDSPTINAEKIRKSRKKKIAAKKPK